jgi:23S rRNA G2445 N2-methylase RlmL
LPFHPQLTFYVRKNQGRLLLKINKQEMYKHGWKKQVGWAPIRETLVAAILNHTRILEQSGTIKLWDPFCGSATIPIVAAAQYYSLKVRGNPE